MTAPKPPFTNAHDLRESCRAVADTLATALHAADCGCTDWSPGDEEDPRYDKAAGKALTNWTMGGTFLEEWGARYHAGDPDGDVDTWRETRAEAEAMIASRTKGGWRGPSSLVRRFVIVTAPVEVTE